MMTMMAIGRTYDSSEVSRPPARYEMGKFASFLFGLLQPHPCLLSRYTCEHLEGYTGGWTQSGSSVSAMAAKPRFHNFVKEAVQLGEGATPDYEPSFDRE